MATNKQINIQLIKQIQMEAVFYFSEGFVKNYNL